MRTKPPPATLSAPFSNTGSSGLIPPPPIQRDQNREKRGGGEREGEIES
jgi:hypothetical protein